MKIALFVFAAVLVATLGIVPAYESQMVYATDAPRVIKSTILIELQSIELDQKKDQKKLNKAIKNLERSLQDKFWQDDSYLSMIGKKAFNADKRVIKNLDKIKSHDFALTIDSLVEANMQLAQNQIDLLPTDTGVKKLDRKLAKALDQMTKAQEDLDKNKQEKAIDHFKKAWKLAKMGEDIDVPDSGSADYSNDGIPDYYVQLQYTGKDNKPVILGYKIQNECVDLGPKDPKDVGGDTYDDAAMKIGVSTVNNEFLIDNVKVWNKWFKDKKNDSDRMVDLINPPKYPLPKYTALDGESVIRESEHGVSFVQSKSISQIGGQSGWEGDLFFDAPPGDYIFWTVHPAGGIDECDRLAAQGVHVEIP